MWAKFSARKLSHLRLKRLKPSRLLVLCYGNIYRSPFVAEYLKDRFIKISNVEIKSAGFFPKSGRKSAVKYVEIVNDYRVDLSEHRSNIVDNDLLNWAEAIIIMDGKNFKLSLLLNSGVEEKLIWLGALSPEVSIEIQDPYNKSLNQQRAIVEHMKKSCDALVEKIIQLKKPLNEN